MTRSPWNFAEVFEAVAQKVPDRPALVHGERVVTWREFDRRANALAADLLDAGLTHQSKVACLLYNGPEYLETVFAALKVAMVPVNTNYRYGPDEIVYLFDNADAEAVVVDASLAELIEMVRGQLPNVRRWYVVGAAPGDEPSWATRYESVVDSGTDAPPATPWGRSGDDLVLLYTGGTTGMPKGVMWRQDDFFNVLGSGGNAIVGRPPASDLEELVSRIEPATPGPVALIGCPLMHGTGQNSALKAMAVGATIVTLCSRRFDVGEMFATAERRRVTDLIIVGQAFAAPMLAALDANPGQYDLSSLVVIVSSGVMWSQPNKDGMLGHIPQVLLFDAYGSSEAIGLGGSVSSAGGTQHTATFALGPNAGVFTEDGGRVEPGSGEQGLVAVSGYIPLGYWKDDAKTAATFRVFEGRRWSVPGDWANVNQDGTLNLLGRGSACINTGGEKVFPEEVEEVLKTHPSIRDAVAVGIPDDRFGQSICAVVEPESDAVLSLSDVNEFVKTKLAAYKAPRHLVLVDTIGRAPNGKVDYTSVNRTALERSGVTG